MDDGNLVQGVGKAYFPNLVFKTVHIKGKIQFLRWLAVQFQRHMFGVLEYGNP